jgi:hypothetical protein
MRWCDSAQLDLHQNVRQLFLRSLTSSELRWEYGWFFATAFLNIFVFAAFFRMFGLVHGDAIVKDDWSIAQIFFAHYVDNGRVR